MWTIVWRVWKSERNQTKLFEELCITRAACTVDKLCVYLDWEHFWRDLHVQVDERTRLSSKWHSNTEVAKYKLMAKKFDALELMFKCMMYRLVMWSYVQVGHLIRKEDINVQSRSFKMSKRVFKQHIGFIILNGFTKSNI